MEAPRTQKEVVDFLASIAKCIPKDQRDVVLENVSRAMVEKNIEPIPDGTYKHIVDPSCYKGEEETSKIVPFKDTILFDMVWICSIVPLIIFITCIIVF